MLQPNYGHHVSAFGTHRIRRNVQRRVGLGRHPATTVYRLRVRHIRTEGRLDFARLGEEVCPDWCECYTWVYRTEGLLK